MAIFLNSVLTLWPALAEVSIDITPCSFARLSRSSGVTWLSKTGEWLSLVNHWHDTPLVIQICLVPHKHNNNVLPSLISHIIDPLWSILERRSVCCINMSKNTGCHRLPELTCDVVYNDGDGGVSDVGWNEGSESFLIVSNILNWFAPYLSKEVRWITRISITADNAMLNWSLPSYKRLVKFSINAEYNTHLCPTVVVVQYGPPDTWSLIGSRCLLMSSGIAQVCLPIVAWYVLSKVSYIWN